MSPPVRLHDAAKERLQDALEKAVNTALNHPNAASRTPHQSA